jgi:hypothetical protein
MWLGILVVLIAVFAAIGGTLAGGVFTIVLIPLAAVGLVVAFVSVSLVRASQRRQASDQTPGNPSSVESPNALPRTHARPPGNVPTTPEGLTDARRAQQ